MRYTVGASKNHDEPINRVLDMSGMADFCPVAAGVSSVLAALDRGAGPDDYLFVACDGKTPLSYDTYRKEFKGCLLRARDRNGRRLDISKYGPHSLRAGGATALFDAGCSALSIKQLGRWSSSCFERYCRETAAPFLGLAEKMVDAAMCLL